MIQGYVATKKVSEDVLWCRGTESNCRHQSFQDVVVLYKELKLLVIFRCGERGQLNGQRVTSSGTVMILMF